MATILIVDDHVLNREFLLTLLGYGGHRLLEAADGVEGLRVIQAEKPDLIIADILMPNMDGYEFVTRIHAEPSLSEIPIIFYTAAYREREAKVLAMACGVRWMLTKPSAPEIILQVVSEALGIPADEVLTPALQSPPAEGARFSTIENQLSEYLVELQNISVEIAQGRGNAGAADNPDAPDSDADPMAPRLSRALFNLQAVSLRLTALIELGLELSAEHNLESLVDVGCRVIHHICAAKIACVGALDESGEKLSQFASRGLDEVTRASVAAFPPHSGVLRKLLEGTLPQPLKLNEEQLRNLGFSSEATEVTERPFLAVTIASRARIYGWIYLIDKVDADDFTEVDVRLATTVATQLAVAYENLNLYAETQRQHSQLKQEMAARAGLNESLRRFRMAMDATADAILLIDCANMRFLDINDTACRMLGYYREELFFLGPEALGIGACNPLPDTFEESVEGYQYTGMSESQAELRHKDGSFFPVELHQRIMRSDDSCIMVTVARNITERKEAEQKLIHLAHYDTLTSLPNRVLFYESLQKILLQADENHWSVAVLFIDLDRFKSVNDSLGHAIGDELLRQFAKRLTHCMRIRDVAGRLGGDEFAMIMVMPEGRQNALGIVNKIRKVLQPQYYLKGHEINATASIGITLYPHDARDSETLIKYADTAMYQAKEAGRDAYRFFTGEMNLQVMARLELENALRDAVDRRDFVLHYQPKVEIESGRIVGAEALIRWKRAGHGLLAPDGFVSLLEESGLIGRVGNWVIGAACRQIRDWINAGIGPVPISVNVSSKQFFDDNFETQLIAAITENGIDPALLELELTEASLMSNSDDVITLLMQLRALGVRISIDDFGTGYSSLAYLKRFPLDTLKIDIAFIRDITTNAEDAAIANAVIKMAHSLKLKVVAEGVETEAQLAYLRRHGCDQMQGYLFSRPVSALDFAYMQQQGKCLPIPFDLNSSQNTLLIVDDDAVVTAVLSRLLRQDGYRVLTATTAEEGFELLAKNPVQVILCDQCMPVMDGIEFLNKVKDLYPHTFRIMLSGVRELQPIMDALNSGAIFRFYTKPWESKVLRENIREAFRRTTRHAALDTI